MLGTHRTKRPLRGYAWTLPLLATLSVDFGLGPGMVEAQPAAAAGGRLLISVLDSTGGRIPQPTVLITRVDAGNQPAPVTISEEQGEPMAIDLPSGHYRLRVSAPGFREATLFGTVRPLRTTRLRVRLALAQIEETVIVRRDPQTTALDPRGFSTFLSREQIEALPDDPDELVRVLRAMAPPGAVIRIDGFAGGPMPSKIQILSIRIPRLDVLPARSTADSREARRSTSSPGPAGKVSPARST
jgi:hypothetical protein